MGRFRAWYSATLTAYSTVLRNAGLRRSQLAWAGAVTAEWAFFVGVGVFAYEHGGTLGVGVVGLVRMLPSALIGPFASALGDRYRRDRVVLGLFVAMGAAAAVAALIALAEPPTAFIYVLAAVHASASTLSRSAQWAMLPSLSHTPEELVAANGATMTTENVGLLAGPALGGILLGATDVEALFGACAAVYLLSAVLLARIQIEEQPREAVHEPILSELLGGFRAVGRQPAAAFVIGLFCAQTLVRGALNVFIVVIAFQLLDIGESGVGFLTAAFGAGGLAGALFSFSLAGRPLARPFAGSLVLWGAPIVAIAVWPEAAVAFGMMAIIGSANSVLDVAGLTLLQRLVPNEVLARVLGVLWGVAMACMGVGSILAAGLLASTSVRSALIVTGLLLPVLTVVSWRRLASIDRSAAIPTVQLEALQRVPMLAHLSLVAKEEVASRLVLLEEAEGAEVIHEGDAGDRFYILVDGDVDVISGGETLAVRQAPDFFGEIALLRDVPRTATVRARSPLRLYALERDDFLAAVTSHTAAREAGHAIVTERLATT